jgi:type VI secretion system protein ImpJ
LAWDNKVVWNEGLFLQPQHFQQQDRYIEALVGGVATSVAPYVWGVSELTIDEELLRLGKIALKSARGMTPDGAIFRVPAADDHPPAMDVPETVKNTVVYLTIPTRRHGATEVDMSGAEKSAARFRPAEIDVTNAVGNEKSPATLAVGKLRLNFALDVDDTSDLLVIPIARIIEVRSDSAVVLDKGFIPSCLDVRASGTLADFLQEVEGLLSHRCDALAGRLAEGGPAKGAAEIQDFLLLQCVNRYLPMVRHLTHIENTHPCTMYEMLLGLAGELSTFMDSAKRLPDMKPYKHEDLTGTFRDLMRALRQYLSAVLEQNAVKIALEARKYGISVAMVADKRLLGGAKFVLAAKAEVTPESLRRHFPTQVKIGPVESIRQLVNSALPGVDMRPLPVAPRQVPFNSGTTYFELDRDGPLWKQLTTSGGIAVHVAGDFPGLEMELWAIRNA